MLKKAILEFTDEVAEQPLSNFVIDEYLPDANILKYNDLQNKNISSIFQNNNYVILLIESQPNNGHWVCLLRYDDGTIEYFDSYAKPIDYFINKLKHSPNSIPYLSDILDNYISETNNKVIYNGLKFQVNDSDINTCGRHVVFRILQYNEHNKKLGEYIKFMKGFKKENPGFTYDDIVAFYIKKTD